MLLTVFLAIVFCAAITLMLLAAVAFIQDKKFFSSAPKEAQAVIQPRENELFYGARVIGWTLMGFALLMILGVGVLSVWDGFRSGFSFSQFFLRFVLIFTIYKLYDMIIKVFGKTKSSYDRFVHDAYEAAHSYIDWMRSSILPFTFAMVIMPATMVSVLPVGGLLVKSGTLAAQDLVTVIILSVGIITPLITLMSYSDDFRTMGTIFGEVQNILNAPEMVRSDSGSAPEENSLKLSDVRFSYQEKEVLHGISMDIPEGSFIALVGPSGSGKSTIARLIASLWDVSSGSISLGGEDIRRIPQEAYSDKVAFVSQDNYLFNHSYQSTSVNSEISR